MDTGRSMAAQAGELSTVTYGTGTFVGNRILARMGIEKVGSVTGRLQLRGL